MPLHPHVALPELVPEDEPDPELDPETPLDPLLTEPEDDPDEGPDEEPEEDPEGPEEDPDAAPEELPVVPELSPLPELEPRLGVAPPPEHAAARAIARHTGTPSSKRRTRIRSPRAAARVPHPYRRGGADKRLTRDAEQAQGAARWPLAPDGDRALFVHGRILTLFAVAAALSAAACSSSSQATPDAGGSPVDAAGMDGTDGAEEEGGASVTFNVFDHIPQFGVYVGHDPPGYTPPPGVLLWAHGAVFVTKLTPMQQAAIGADLVARITYHAQCDNYDRIGGVFFVREPAGQTPQPTDPQTELVRFITPFSDYTQGAHATHVFPDADLSAYAQVLADPTHDIWIGIGGGSNPYSMDPCVALSKPADFQAVGFLYSLDFVSSKPLVRAPSTVFSAEVSGPGGYANRAWAPQAIADFAEPSTPIHGTFDNPGGPLTGHVTVIVSGHGSDFGGDEYEHTDDTVTVGGVEVGLFSTQIDCGPFAAASPDGNPGIFMGNTTYNPRNWCPGALVPSHTFPVSLAGWAKTAVTLGVSPPRVPMGSDYATSITFSAP
jgi:hypothetical protein